MRAMLSSVSRSTRITVSLFVPLFFSPKDLKPHKASYDARFLESKRARSHVPSLVDAQPIDSAQIHSVAIPYGAKELIATHTH